MEYTFKRFEDLEYSDDWMFKKVMESKDICKKVIERLLHIQIEDITYPVLDQTISPYYTSHGVRLDVYVKDSDRVFDIEIQSYKEDALGKRMRYYQSMVDIDSLMKGDDYTKLKESYIIFICTKNPMDDSKTAEKIFETELDEKTVANRAVFTFKNTCQENTRIKLNDKSVKEIYNANAYESETDPDTKAFLKFVCKNTAGDNLTNEIRNRIDVIKPVVAKK
ncbi:MAG: Rpn family recombination-promoting nuclease/putative transposase [Treponema sp.]|nr:Rpn family recombination-promoting nuclease/putative transposase [Treponema sp.]